MKATLLCLLTSLALSSCTYSVNIAQTDGEGTDVIDETSSNTPTAQVEIPLKP